jgi:hypothetical protein
VLKGGTIPAATAKALREVEAGGNAPPATPTCEDIEENMHYILQCSSDEAFAGQLERALNLGLIDAATKRRLLDELAGATCHHKRGVCAFNGTGNSSRTLLAAFGLVAPELELLTGLPSDEAVMSGVDSLFGLLNKPEFRVSEILRCNFANLVRIHNATGSSSNILLHLPIDHAHSRLRRDIQDYHGSAGIPGTGDLCPFADRGPRHFRLALQFAAGQHRGMESLYRVLTDLGVPMDLGAPTVTGSTWGERIRGLAVRRPGLGERAVIRTRPLRPRSGVDGVEWQLLRECGGQGVGHVGCLYEHFDDHVFIVRYTRTSIRATPTRAARPIEHLGRTEG